MCARPTTTSRRPVPIVQGVNVGVAAQIAADVCGAPVGTVADEPSVGTP